ncbi:carbohydrate sulfotransferase 9-like [Haliotis rufescens]|uniref:carbohydrate sulfotransferase 9-like n=1 Tax=Haliotis rufescens TaxID=6454 RepID=UPI00201F6CEB|nr:carbohydrate sulfotransferase 9-like [Haliotis rufescens]
MVFTIDPNSSAAFCAIPKVGSSTLKRILYWLHTNQSESSPFSLNGNAIHYVTGMKQYFQNAQSVSPYKTFMFVRDPYKRLFSAFIDRLFIPSYKEGSFSQQIINGVRSQPDVKARACGSDVTFTDAVLFVILTYNTPKISEWHFSPQRLFCHQCEINYDVIGKMETFSRDVRYILRKFGMKDVPVDSKEMSSDSDINIMMDISNASYTIRHTLCMATIDVFRRLWKTFQIRGFLGRHNPFPLRQGDALSLEGFQALLRSTYKSDESWRGSGRHQQRELALIVAYRTVPMEYLERLKEIYRPDCELFGYDPEPPEVFNRDVKFENFGFFSHFKQHTYRF